MWITGGYMWRRIGDKSAGTVRKMTTRTLKTPYYRGRQINWHSPLIPDNPRDTPEFSTKLSTRLNFFMKSPSFIIHNE
jgi:hypothetical protein